MSKTRWSRRRFLRGAGVAAASLPFLEALAPRRAMAAPGTPKRLLVVLHRQGTVMDRWLPTGTEYDWQLSDILSPLSDWQDRITVVAGLDNVVPDYNSAGDGHTNAEQTLLTGQVYADETASALSPAGPSFEQVVAERISADRPFSRLDFAVGGDSSGYQTAGHFWVGPDDPVVATSSPLLASITSKPSRPTSSSMLTVNSCRPTASRVSSTGFARARRPGGSGSVTVVRVDPPKRRSFIAAPAEASRVWAMLNRSGD